MTELRACPFCSGERVDYDSLLFTKKGKVIYAKCPDCGTSFRVLEHVYNHRPIEVRQAREVAELRDKCLAQAAEISHLTAYCDKLAAGYPDGMLPTDIQVIKDANYTFAQQVFEKDAEIDHLQAVVVVLLDHLPDSHHEDDDSWTWCWEELSGDAQDAVKFARKTGNDALKESE